jgi:hypothetical protein
MLLLTVKKHANEQQLNKNVTHDRAVVPAVPFTLLWQILQT